MYDRAVSNVLSWLIGVFTGITCTLIVVKACGCSSGGDDDVLQVAGIYEITSGSQKIITPDTSQEEDLTGYVVDVSQNGRVLGLVSCVGELDSDGNINCDGSESWSYTFFGAQLVQSTGSVHFEDQNGTIVLTTEDLGANVTMVEVGTGGRFEFKLNAKKVY